MFITTCTGERLKLDRETENSGVAASEQPGVGARRRVLEERTMVCITIPRCDANEGGALEVTVTSELQAQAERTKKQKREEKAASGGSGRDRARDGGA